jgi:hypothetical protein
MVLLDASDVVSMAEDGVEGDVSLLVELEGLGL